MCVYDGNIIYENLREVSRTTKRPKDAPEGFYETVGKMVNGLPLYDNDQRTTAPSAPAVVLPAPTPSLPTPAPAPTTTPKTITVEPGAALLQTLADFRGLAVKFQEGVATLQGLNNKLLTDNQKYREDLAELIRQNLSLQNRVDELQQLAQKKDIDLTITSISPR